MNIPIYVFLTTCSLVLTFNCNTLVTDKFNEAKGNTSSNLITNIATQSFQDDTANRAVFMSYDTFGTGTVEEYDNTGSPQKTLYMRKRIKRMLY